MSKNTNKPILIIERLELGPLMTNCYLVTDPSNSHTAVIDPGDEGKRIYRILKEKDWQLEQILLTHGHYDHIGGVNDLLRCFQAPIWIHEYDAHMPKDATANLSVFLGSSYVIEHDCNTLSDGMTIQVGSVALKVIHTPGHTPGSVSFIGDDFAIVGDTLFRNSIGRTDFPCASTADLVASIKNKLLILKDTVRVYPGHGAETTIGHEKEKNPFIATSQFNI
jgi:hydroxyacylglutathione hydrolase